MINAFKKKQDETTEKLLEIQPQIIEKANNDIVASQKAM